MCFALLHYPMEEQLVWMVESLNSKLINQSINQSIDLLVLNHLISEFYGFNGDVIETIN